VDALAPDAGDGVVSIAFPRYFRYGFRLGTGFRGGKLREDVKDAYKGTMAGIGGGLELFYHFHRNYGVGIDYSFYNAFGNENGRGDEHVMNTYIHYVLPSLILTFPARDRENSGLFVTCSPIGYAGFFERHRVDGFDVWIRGGDVASSFDVGYDFGLNPRTSLTLSAGVRSASLGKIKYDTGQVVELDKKERENISSFHLSLGLRFR
jgi:hypothetical protein